MTRKTRVGEISRGLKRRLETGNLRTNQERSFTVFTANIGRKRDAKTTREE